MKKKILIYLGDINPKKNSSWGIFNTSKSILIELIKSKKFNIILVITNKNKNIFSEIKCEKIILNEKKNKILNKIFLENIEVTKIIKEKKPEIAFFPRGFIPLRKIKGTTYISLIYDLIILYYLKRLNFRAAAGFISIFFSIRFSDRIITISKFSKKEISKFSKKEIIQIPLGNTPVIPKMSNLKKKGYVFILGNKNPHKNLKKSIKLVKDYNRIMGKDYKIYFSNGNISPEEIAGYYQNARFSIFLSEIEGFGLPLIESYYYKTPIVFNNKTALKEIGQNLPGKCDVNNKGSVFRAINEVISLNNAQIMKLRKKLLKEYHWSSCGRKITKEFLKPTFKK